MAAVLATALTFARALEGTSTVAPPTSVSSITAPSSLPTPPPLYNKAYDPLTGLPIQDKKSEETAKPSETSTPTSETDVAPSETDVPSSDQIKWVKPSKPPKDMTPPNLRENPADNIPFPQPSSGFKDNPNQSSMKIAAMPDVLQPMGPPIPPIKFNNPMVPKGDTPIELPARPVVEIPQATEKTASAGVSQETVTASPFLDWIQNTKNAVEIARQQRQAIEKNAVQDKTPRDGTDQDLFLHIRFPYVGNQDLPPSGGSVTYSVPQR